MLVITRKAGETFVLQTGAGETITVFIKQVQGTRVSVGIEAPQTVNISRRDHGQGPGRTPSAPIGGR